MTGKLESLVSSKTPTSKVKLTAKLFIITFVVLNSTDLKAVQLFAGVEALVEMDVV